MPSADVSYFGFSSEKHGKITLHNAKDVTGVSVKVLEPILGITVAEYELTAEDIAAGEYTLPVLDSGDVYMEHMAEYDATWSFPETLELHVTVRYNTADGEKTLEYTVQDKEEQGWGLLYWQDDEPATDWSWPGYFRFAAYESSVPVTIVIDEPDRVEASAETSVLSVSLSIDGRKVLPEECEFREEDADGVIQTRLFLKRPSWAPDHGTIHVSVIQRLSDGTVWTTEKDVSY